MHPHCQPHRTVCIIFFRRGRRPISVPVFKLVPFRIAGRPILCCACTQRNSGGQKATAAPSRCWRRGTRPPTGLLAPAPAILPVQRWEAPALGCVARDGGSDPVAKVGGGLAWRWLESLPKAFTAGGEGALWHLHNISVGSVLIPPARSLIGSGP